MASHFKRPTRIVIWAGTAALLVHFAMTLIYTVPGVPVPAKAHGLAYRYMVPMFHQGWKLFAPDVPDYQIDVLFRYRPKQAAWQDWQSIQDVHGDARMHYALAKMSGPLSTALNDEEMGLYYVDSIPQFDRVETTGAYKAMVYYFIKEFQSRNQTPPDSLQLLFYYRFTPGLNGDTLQPDIPIELPPVDIPEKP